MENTTTPWIYEYDNDTGPEDDYFEEFFTIYGKGRIEIARVHEREDARLIAAAPDLLEALKLLIRPHGGTVATFADSELATKARAAIAKAMGDQ